MADKPQSIPDIADEVLKEADAKGKPSTNAAQQLRDREEAQRRVETLLAEIAENAPEDEAGEAKVVIGDRSFRVTGSLWPLTILLVKTVLAAHDPSGIGWMDVASQIIDTLEKVRDEIHKLDATEVAVCAGVAKTESGTRRTTGATSSDIVKYLESVELDEPQGLDEVLEKLVEKKVLKRDDGPPPRYKVTF